MSRNVIEIVQRVKNGRVRSKGCNHVDQIQEVTPSSGEGCQDCLKIGDRWIHLRLCLTCGYVGCCDSSKNKHASQHSREAGHPIVMSFEPNEEWLWCYSDKVLLLPS